MSTDPDVERQLWAIAEKGQFAILLDILTPKPGNVHRYKDHEDTRFVHFAASITRLGYPLYLAAQYGYFRQTNVSDPESKLGELIKNAVMASMEPHDKNTLLGTVMLLIPLTAAAGSVISQKRVSIKSIREKLTEILHRTTIEDAVQLIRALQIASPGGAIPKTSSWTSAQEDFDFQSPHTIKQIQRMKYTLKDLQGLAASYDAIAQEYTTDFSFIFDTLYPQLQRSLNRHPIIEDSILSTFLWMLSQRLDTFIQRKVGVQAAEEVQKRAKKLYESIIKKPESQWSEQLESFDDYLRSKGTHLNPGTTADLLSAAIFLALLCRDIQTIF